jgi:hypothetical protein
VVESKLKTPGMFLAEDRLEAVWLFLAEDKLEAVFVAELLEAGVF